MATRPPTQLTVLTAVLDGHVEELCAAITAVPLGDDSPFASLPGTHNGRWTVVTMDDTPRPRFRAGGLPAPMLTCSGTIDIEPGDWLRALLAALGERADAIWSHCAGWAEAPDKVAYLLAHRVQSMLEFATWDAPVDTVRQALLRRRAAEQLAVRSQRASDDELVAMYRELIGR
jgi:hypothetical protein